MSGQVVISVTSYAEVITALSYGFPQYLRPAQLTAQCLDPTLVVAFGNWYSLLMYGMIIRLLIPLPLAKKADPPYFVGKKPAIYRRKQIKHSATIPARSIK